MGGGREGRRGVGRRKTGTREAGSEGANPLVEDDVVGRAEDTMTMNYDNDH